MATTQPHTPQGPAPVQRPNKRHAELFTSKGCYVDIAIAPILEAAWREGIETQYSCQEGNVNGMAMIVFPDIPNGVNFVQESLNRWGWDMSSHLWLRLVAGESAHRTIAEWHPDDTHWLRTAWEVG